MGHVLRAQEDDPMRQVVFEQGTYKERRSYKIRPGRPKPSWIINTMKDAWDEIAKVETPDQLDLPKITTDEEYEWENERHNEIIAFYAIVRSEVFSTNASKNWYLKQHSSRLEEIFQQLDNME